MRSMIIKKGKKVEGGREKKDRKKKREKNIMRKIIWI